jgi:hypothetical protein
MPKRPLEGAGVDPPREGQIGGVVHPTRGQRYHARSLYRRHLPFRHLRSIEGKRSKLDPFTQQHHVKDCHAYVRLGELSDSQVNALIDLLTVECVTAHMLRPTELVHYLSQELEVDARKDWRPEAPWLSSFKKIQLVHLITELKGSVHAPAPEREKSELVEVLAKLFADAAECKLEDKKLAERVNRWLPSNIQEGVLSKMV